MALISLTEWAKKNGIASSTARQKALRGTLPAQKVGRDWLIEESVLNTDSRITSKKYAQKKQWIVCCDLSRAINQDDTQECVLPTDAQIFCGRARTFVTAITVHDAIAKGTETLKKELSAKYKITNIGANYDTDEMRKITEKYLTIK